MRVLGLDYGSTTCGIAVSDESETISSPVDTIRYKEKEDLLTKLDEYIEKYKPGKIVLGNPINLDGSISKRSKETFLFKDEITKRYKIEVILEDERLTSVIVNNMLINNGSRRDKRKKVVDKLAASLILGTYLDRSKNGR